MSDLTLAGTAHRNRLADQTSPYLLQHADNPVDWYPWGEEALELARREDRPILLSIGYSACHWCHVMAHESFEDPETARLMNAGFVNIKVDREERPDLDRIYQAAHQILTGRGGGWPLTLFLTPDQTPFFGGTYFPPEARHGLPGFPQLLERVAQFYRENRDRIHEQNAAVQEALSRDTPAEAAPGNLNGSPLAKGVEQLAGSHDRHHGGFGGAPKFPHASSLEFLLRQGGGEARDIALHTLRAMARGGIRDHLGGGFYRYSVDERWMIPHFEKMLYDNGPLLTLYADAWRTTGDRIFRQAAETTGTWVLREMQSPEGAYFATQDADSEGREGAYYLWTPGQARALLDEDEYQVLAHRYGLDGPANFEGQWHLHIQTDPGTAATESGLEEDQAKALLERAVDKLFAARSERVPPGRDEKVLTAWNALMLKGMARAGRLLGRGDFIASAERSLDFIRAELYRDGRLFTACRDGKGHLPAYLDDHAFLIDGVLELLQARWRDGDLAFALELAEILLEHFEDESGGGFFFTADDHERLIQRPKPFMDESTPAGNGIAAMALNRLGHIVGDMNLLDAAQRTVSAAWPALQEIPYAHASLLMALEELLEPSQILVLRGGTEALTPWANTLDTGYAPHRITLVIPPEARDLPELLAAHRPEPGTVMAYLCKDRRCTPPLRDPAALAEALRE